MKINLMSVRHTLLARFIFTTVIMRVILAIPASAASFGGIVVTDSGEPVSGAGLSWNNNGICSRTPSGGLSCFPPTVIGSTKTADDGHFLAADLPADSYHFCAQPVTANQLG